MPDLFPTLFVSHGAPTLVEEEGGAAAFLRRLGRTLPRPRAILCVTAHWETSVPTIGACPAPSTLHDFVGFPKSLYELRYPAPGAVAAAADTAAALRQAGLSYAVDHSRGLDHGTWVPLMLMYPDAQVPVAQLSVQPEAGPQHHLALGRALAPLRASGILILCSGAAVHNLAELGHGTPDWAESFQAWLTRTVSAGSDEDLVAYRNLRPEGSRAHPRDEHLLPLLVAMGAGGGAGRPLYEGFALGSVGMAAYAFEGGEDLLEGVGQRRSRLRRDDRERMILEEAIGFFCEHGLEGQTRALADRLNITQPLIYRYFPDKDALLNRVFEELMARRWKPEWPRLLGDRSRPFEDRLSQFVVEYGKALCQDSWMRLIVSAGMKDCDFDKRFLDQVRSDVVLPLCAEARAAFNLPSAEEAPYSPAELEAAWSIHARLFFLALREWLHRAEAAQSVDALAPGIVAGYLATARTAALPLDVAKAAE